MGTAYDFCGWATRAGVKCADNRTIMKDAFKGCHGKTVPLVWNHMHNDPTNILGHALLKSVDGDIYAYCSFNESDSGQAAKTLVEHGDISSLSILANDLTEIGDRKSPKGSSVVHGVIREVSLVLAGANPKAYIETVIAHNGDVGETATIYAGEPIDLKHGELKEEEYMNPSETITEEQTVLEHAASGEETEKDKTVGEILNTLNEEQKNAVAYVIGEALKETTDESDDEEGGKEEMKHNVFDNEQEETQDGVLTHAQQLTIINDAKRFGSMKESVIQHAAEYGIDQIDYLIPEPKTLTNVPTFIQRDMGWVQDVMGAIRRSPFSRIKSIFANITEDEARAKGYMKGKLKKEEVFGLLKRTTTPTTIYKKQKMDRDDMIDITDFDVIAWLKSEMRMMLDEELARAILVGDGRLASSDDKINEQNIRPIWKDEELYTIKAEVSVTSSATADDKAQAFIRAAIKARKDYKGSGNPTLFTTEDFLTDMLLLTDTTGRDLYDSVEKLTKKLRVSKIVTVPVMEGLKTSDGKTLMGIIVNLTDYNIGADKGGAINMFDDFDIDYNQQKYLIETRCSGALIRPYSAIAIEMKVSG